MFKKNPFRHNFDNSFMLVSFFIKKIELIILLIFVIDVILILFYYFDLEI